MAVRLITAIEVIYAFGVLFIACELFQRIVLAFDKCNDTINQLKWYLFPVDMQPMLPIIISATQQPIETKCFGSMACDRESFKYVS